jgi:hypothetical protein
MPCGEKAVVVEADVLLVDPDDARKPDVGVE